MSIRLSDIGISLLVALIVTPVVLSSIAIGNAQVMQSTNYRIESDSVNFGGGFSSSTNYQLESTGGEIASGESSSTNYSLRAGYQQMTTRSISMTTPTAVTMTPSLVGITGGESNGSTTVTVTTDSAAGYSLSIAASNAPAMTKGSDVIQDYVPGGVPDFTFTTDPSDSHFGYSPSGINVVQRFKDSGGVCDVDVNETALACWDGLSTTARTIAQSSSANVPNGATTTIYFKVGLGNGVVQAPGIYTATSTLTAVSL